jgi:DNA-binding IscR family transcriptional regulator
MRRLVGAGILLSRRAGTQRGYALARLANQISVREVLECLEGSSLFERCLFWSDICQSEPCPLHACWETARSALAAATATTTLAGLNSAARVRQSKTRPPQEEEEYVGY